MEDHILRLTAGGGSVLAFIADTRQTVGRAAEIHRGTPVVSAALGRLLTAAAIIGATLKNDGDLVTLSIRGDGPLGGIVATSDNKSRVKGYPFNRDADAPLTDKGKLNISAVIGNGSLHIIKDMGLKEPYAGSVPLVSGEIAEDLASYYATSEQTPSAVGLGV
ncbi:MAG: Hsp33 family molecular chaperone HslO, partial [Synergistaceae bacterium]|nr:Hsp33 family molecular chaperone HslO [Synergistaceae bacterium]